MQRLISFDIDGTLELGDPPGIITIDMVRQAKENGWVIGSCSDRPVSAQIAMWERHGVVVDFTVAKPGLDVVREQFEADAYLHIGDTEIDRQYALRAGFDFLHVDNAHLEEWLVELGEFYDAT